MPRGKSGCGSLSDGGEKAAQVSMPGTANEQTRPPVKGPGEAGAERFGTSSGRAAAEPTRALRETLLAPIPMRP